MSSLEAEVAKPLLEVLRDVSLDPTERAAFATDPSDYLAQHGYEDVSPEDLGDAFDLMHDTLPAETAQALAEDPVYEAPTSDDAFGTHGAAEVGDLAPFGEVNGDFDVDLLRGTDGGFGDTGRDADDDLGVGDDDGYGQGDDPGDSGVELGGGYQPDDAGLADGDTAFGAGSDDAGSDFDDLDADGLTLDDGPGLTGELDPLRTDDDVDTDDAPFDSDAFGTDLFGGLDGDLGADDHDTGAFGHGHDAGDVTGADHGPDQVDDVDDLGDIGFF